MLARPLLFYTVVFLKYIYPVVDVDFIEEEEIQLHFSSSPLFFFHVLLSRLLHLPSVFLHLYSLEIYPGVYGVQLAVQGVERRSL